MTIKSPVIRYHGGKFRIASWVIEHFPPHHTYTEAFGGAAGVLMQKPRAYAEVYNDLDGDIVNLFRVLQDSSTRAALTEQLVLTPYARAEFDQAWAEKTDPVDRARCTIIRAMMGFGSAGATKGTTGFRIDTKRQYGTAQHLWAAYPEQIAAIGQRLSGLLIENRPAKEVIEAHDTPNTLHYVDPPYMHDTRVKGAAKGRYYKYELDDVGHKDLLASLLKVDGMVVLSGYDSELYNDTLLGWNTNSTTARISAGRGGSTRKECLWLNPTCMDALHHTGLQLGQTA
ncbi:DNA adenine methylase [Pseudomonas syringae]|uniref:DNA adenine methylase n=1 Tax=Pseudomonas syringae UB303 TaxID=1357287 RepID=A0AAJ4B263_PSESX|nr:DNA adenine methylase [Pseudomonas syringae]QHF10376.1 DNA adenine methylase [Pseudomonas syringae UB303]